MSTHAARVTIPAQQITTSGRSIEVAGETVTFDERVIDFEVELPEPEVRVELKPSTALDVDAQFAGDWHKALAEATNSGGPSPALLAHSRIVDLDRPLTFTRPVAIFGAGSRLTLFRHTGSYTGALMESIQTLRKGTLEGTEDGAPTTHYSPTVDLSGVELHNIGFYSPDRDVPNKRGIYMANADDMRFNNVRFMNLTGTALELGANEAEKTLASPWSGRIRECNFNGVTIMQCGSGSQGSPYVPAMIIQSAKGSGDGTNQLVFNGLRFVYNQGNMLIEGRDDVNALRRIMIRDLQGHGLGGNPNWNPPLWFDLDLIEIRGNVREVMIDGAFTNATDANHALIKVGRSEYTTQTPKRLNITNINSVNTPGSLVDVEACDVVTVEGTQLGADGCTIINNRPGSGLQRIFIHEKGNSNPAGKTKGLEGVKGATWWTGVPV